LTYTIKYSITHLSGVIRRRVNILHVVAKSDSAEYDSKNNTHETDKHERFEVEDS